MATRVTHPDQLVARIKGAVGLGIPTKVVARHANVPHSSVRSYATGARAAEVEPDKALTALFAAFMRGEI